MTETTPTDADFIAANINAQDLALNAILNVLEIKHPGLKAEALAEAEQMLAQLPKPSPRNAGTRDLTLQNLRQIFSE